jgi:hypothetical protein
MRIDDIFFRNFGASFMNKNMVWLPITHKKERKRKRTQ